MNEGDKIYEMPMPPLKLDIATRAQNFELLPSPIAKVIPELTMDHKPFRTVHLPYGQKKTSKTITCKTILDKVIKIDYQSSLTKEHKTTVEKQRTPPPEPVSLLRR